MRFNNHSLMQFFKGEMTPYLNAAAASAAAAAAASRVPMRLESRKRHGHGLMLLLTVLQSGANGEMVYGCSLLLLLLLL
jgi:hypothetical protein